MATKVLVVDDDEKILDLVKAYLERSSFEVVTASDGREALAHFRAERPDLVVLDLMLPEIHGMDLARAIRRESEVPIIMLTAMADDVDRVAGLEAGADDYVVKPFNPRELVARVRAVLRRADKCKERPQEVKAFISSVMRGYESKRAAVRQAIEELAEAGYPIKAVTAELLPASAEPPREATLKKVAESDVYLAILGKRYGYVNPETGLSATHEEYRTAREHGKPILVFLEELPPGEEPDKPQKAFIEEVKDYTQGHYIKKFRNEDRLRYEVYRALDRLLAQALALKPAKR